MAYNATLGTSGTSSVVHVVGDVRNDDVKALRALLDQAAAQAPRRLVIDVHDVGFLAPAGVRCLVFVQQQLPPTAEIVIEGADPMLLARLQLAGLTRSMTIVGRSAPALAAA